MDETHIRASRHRVMADGAIVKPGRIRAIRPRLDHVSRTDSSPIALMLTDRARLPFQFLSFALIGIVGTGVHYLVLIAFVSGAGVAPVIATSAGAVCGAITNYVLNYQLTFRSRKRHFEALRKFLLVAGFGLAINATILEAVVRITEWHYLVAQVITTGVVLFWGFIANRFWTFNEIAGGVH